MLNLRNQSLSESRLDLLTHLLSDRLSAFGVTVSPDQMSDLNDHLTSFLSNELDVSVVAGDTEYVPLDLYFDVGLTTVHQKIRMYDVSLTVDDVIGSLRMGLFTVDNNYSESAGQHVRDKSGVAVGDVVSQYIRASATGFRRYGYVFS